MMMVLFCVLCLVGAMLVIIGIQLAFKDMPIGWSNTWERTVEWLHTPSAKSGLGCIAGGFVIVFCLMVAFM